MSEVGALMWRDASEAPSLVWLMVLPVAAAVVALVRGQRLGWLPVGVGAAQVATWYLSYAVPWPDLGVRAAGSAAAAGTLVLLVTSGGSLVVAGVALGRSLTGHEGDAGP